MITCSETQGWVQPRINEGAVVAGAIATASLCMQYGSRIIESKQSIRPYKKPFFYNPPAASRSLSLTFPQYHDRRVLSMCARQPVKEGFGKGTGFSGSMMNALSFWDDAADQTDAKCQRETKHDKMNRTYNKEHYACRRGILYAVLVGSVAVGMVAFSDTLTGVVPYDKSRLIMMLQDIGVTCGSYCQVCYRKMLKISYDISPLASQLINGFLFYLYYSQTNFGRMTKRKPESTKQCVTFDNVEGVDSAKAELVEIVKCINGDGKYKKLGAKVPKGVLLAGPPGTGKTLLARAVAGEAGVPFFSLSGSELVEVFSGVGAARIRDIFQQARKKSPSIVFIDEIDAMGGKRGKSLNSERDQTLNQLLSEMDGFEKNDNTMVLVIAATNRPESLDSALIRPGEAGVPFFSLSGSELVEVFVGVGAARIRDIFQEARKSLDCKSDQTLNQLLTEMDGFEKDDGTVVVIAATNRPESLDSALMRPGRLSRKVYVGAPDEDGRRKIFALYLRNVLMNENKEAVANLVASRTPGLTGAGLEEIANESVRLAVRRDGDFVTSDDVLQAIDKFKAENDICQ
uniref:probable inactive ATP-dependent zinc metalloprotease FTSHI 3, chloroplastic n=1 Tax=Erigeron canadensis TaxID=72917 RepID=UPI001CB8BEBC|nr:probable inactive ATP-dependent zinc metalloprotease FTSHI 3, chloroplastic [Erigeron canadensis]